MKFVRKAASGSRRRMSPMRAREPVAIAPATHTAQQRRRHVLQGEVEIGNARGADRVDQLVVELGRIEVQQPHPVDTGRDGFDQRHDRFFADTLIAPVRGEVLRDEDDFTDVELVDLVEDRLERARPLLPSECRNGAKPTGSVAAFGNLHVGPRARRPWARQVEQIERTAPRAAAERDRHTEASHRYLWYRSGELVTMTLGKTSGHDDLGALAAAFPEREHDIDRLLTGLFDEGTRIDDDEISRLGRGCGLHPVGQQRADELVRVDLVLGAAEGFYPKTLGHSPRLPCLLWLGFARVPTGRR